MNTKLIAATALILLLGLTIVSLNLILVDETASPIEFDEETGTMYVSTDNPLNKNFTVVVLPDTQGYTEDYPWLFDSQTQWIVNNKDMLNIVFVTHLGDVVGDADNTTQWEIANNSMSRLDGNVPWGALPGNHDGFYGEFTNLTQYDKYFSYDRFNNESWYGGAYQNNNRNSYQLFSAGGDDYLIFHIQYDPSDDILFWVSNVIDQHPDKRVIFATHDYIAGPIDPNHRSNIGGRIWHSLIKQHADQIFLVLCGHASTQSRITDTVNGHVVNQLLSDYQNKSNIKSGWLRILEFCSEHDKIYVKTYSPYLNKYRTDLENEFTLDYDMTGASITVLSNSTVSQIAFDQSLSQVSFQVSGETNTAGYCNVTIPKALLKGDPWTVKIDDEVWRYTSSENTTHSSIAFTYTLSCTSQVVIEGTWVVPESP